MYDLLVLIEQRPRIFLLEARLDYLYVFLSGYKMAATSNKEQFLNIEKLEDFSMFLFTKFDKEYKIQCLCMELLILNLILEKRDWKNFSSTIGNSDFKKKQLIQNKYQLCAPTL